MKNSEIANRIMYTNGKIFSVKFEKRSGGTRDMVCRTGVTKHLRGGKIGYSFKKKGLISVFDMQKKEYRTIPIEGIVSSKISGVVYEGELSKWTDNLSENVFTRSRIL